MSSTLVLSFRFRFLSLIDVFLLFLSLYPKIHQSQPDLAGKITGMLLEMDSSELLYLLENDEALGSKVRFFVSPPLLLFA